MLPIQMGAMNELVRRLKNAVVGSERADRTARFDWHPTATATSAGGELPSAPKNPENGAVGNMAVWKKPGSDVSSVIGATIPADVADFAIVYKGAGVSAPPHGYGVDRVAQMLADKSLAGLDKTVKASAVLAALDAAGVRIQEVIHDGLLRYKALVAFEAAKELETLAARPRDERRGEELRAAIAAFRLKKSSEIEALSKETAAAIASLQRLKSRQRAEEDRLHRTVALFVEALPARVITMPKPADTWPAGTAEPIRELKLADPPETEKRTTHVGDDTVAPAPLQAKPDPGSEEAS